MGTTEDEARKTIERYFSEQKFDQVIKFLTDELQRGSFKSEYYVDRATAYYRLGDLQSAIQDANSAIQCNVDFVRAHEIRAKAYVSQSEYGLALLDYKKINQMIPCTENERKIEIIIRINSVSQSYNYGISCKRRLLTAKYSHYIFSGTRILLIIFSSRNDFPNLRNNNE